MNEKQRFTRVQWVKGVPMQGAGDQPTPWPGQLAGNNPTSWVGHPARTNDFTSWAEHPLEHAPEQWAESPLAEPFQEDTEIPLEEYAFGEEEDFTGEEVADYDLYAEEGEEGEELLEQPFPLEGERHPLLNALLILVVLYIICALAPLFVALFVPLRVFFWLEIGGCVIILGWLLIGVRPPLMIWIKQKLKERKEQPDEQPEGETEDIQ